MNLFWVTFFYKCVNINDDIKSDLPKKNVIKQWFQGTYDQCLYHQSLPNESTRNDVLQIFVLDQNHCYAIKNHSTINKDV